jgi:hypothetical protein
MLNPLKDKGLFAGLTDPQRDQLQALLTALRDANRPEPADDDCA